MSRKPKFEITLKAPFEIADADLLKREALRRFDESPYVDAAVSDARRAVDRAALEFDLIDQLIFAADPSKFFPDMDGVFPEGTVLMGDARLSIRRTRHTAAEHFPDE